MNIRTHWLAWRRDVLVFAGLCVAAVGLGLVINRAAPEVSAALATLPGVLRHVNTDDLDLGSDESRGERRVAARWSYRARVTSGHFLWVRNVVGSVAVEAGAGDSVAVTAIKSFRHSDPASVQLLATPSPDGLTICATGRDAQACGAGDRTLRHHHNDVAVDFTIRVPRGVRLDITTVSGAIHVRGASAPVTVHAANGEVDAETSEGPVTAVTLNGDVHALVRAFADTGPVTLTTVNGSVTAELPAQLNAVVHAATVHGLVESAFPLETRDAMVTHRMSGTVGAGGRRVELHTVNGSIRLLKVTPTK